ncbi:hypothetical protein FE257_012404 [Aspergillus nanangensis]|uniref:Uncharacterized protein n=1 Tax=Aspergillus nanangensis TaxID=2582783 RepID=A0AAD4GYU6_ASPNN|nr:hypothetical protein FE257_012404 [Aspergillus nanangensis]
MSALYNPSCLASITKALPSMLKHDFQIDAQYKWYLQSNIRDIEDLCIGAGGVLNDIASASPVAVYGDKDGNTHQIECYMS